jgi:FAD/FMN-containing dehydrogenase
MLIDDLKNIVGADGWTTDANELEPHLREWRELVFGETSIMVSPATTGEVADVVGACAAADTAVVPQGGNTGLCGGAIPDQTGEQVLLNLSRLNRIRTIEPTDFSMTVEAGCVLADVQSQAEAVDRFFPLSLSAEGSCQIGGNLATNAGGINVVRYGTTRDLVLGLEVVLADGSIWDGLRSLRKDTAGYDLKQLFIGSEGTLGIITAATLKLFPPPGETATALVAIDDAATATALLGSLRKSFAESVQSFELIGDSALELVIRHIPGTRSPFAERYPWHVLVEVATGGDLSLLERALAEQYRSGGILDAAMAKNAAEAEKLWRIRHSVSEAQKHEGKNIKHDISVPVGSMAEFIADCAERLERDFPGARPVVFGHVGDGNLHYNVYPPAGIEGEKSDTPTRISDTIYELVAAARGSFSAEHGVGCRKRELLQRYRGGVELTLMRRLKAALDPKNTLNPGKVI